MKRETARRIATNFYTFRIGDAPADLTVKSMGPANGKIVLQTTAYDEDEGEDITYEIEIDPTCGRIAMKRLVDEYDLDAFTQGTKLLSELKPGDRFRLEGDCAVWEFYGQQERFGSRMFGVTRIGRNDIDWLARDRTVYPCGK